jgi:hypothetical protein
VERGTFPPSRSVNPLTRLDILVRVVLVSTGFSLEEIVLDCEVRLLAIKP